jgi:hypothetical protein
MQRPLSRLTQQQTDADLHGKYAYEVGATDPMLGTRGHDNNIPCHDIAQFPGPAYREVQLGGIVTTLLAE